MLLKHLYDFAQSRRLLDDLAFEKGSPIRWIIHLNSDGTLVGAGPQETLGARLNKGKEYDVPRTSRATNSGTVADFLVDDIGAIFGLNPRPDRELSERATVKLKAKHQDFWRQIEAAKSAGVDSRVTALLLFRNKLGKQPPPFLRLENEPNKKWIVATSAGEHRPLGNDRLTFAVDRSILLLEEPIREHWRALYKIEIEDAESTSPRGVCLITGESNVPIARTHTPMVKGLPRPAKGTGAGIVSGDKSAFLSYGLDQAYNAPCSIAASKAYLLALQYLKSHEDHWLSLGPAWLCFWAAKTEAASTIFSGLLRKADTLAVRRFMVAPWAGLERPPLNSEQFIAATLTATGPRIVVKEWLQITIGQAEENFRQWFADLEIQGLWEEDPGPAGGPSPYSLFNLACTTLRRKQDGRFDLDELKPDLIAALYQAALKGSVPSISMLKPLLDRLQANLAKEGIKALRDQSRFALLRLIINRYHRTRKESGMEIQAKITADTKDPAYNCGRLLSVLNSLQRAAHEGRLEGATIAERYFGSASTNPNAAFSILWRLHQHHLKKLRQKGEKGQRASHRIRQTITEICARFPASGPSGCPEFPRVFALVAQSRFALGFYQQEAERAEAVRLWKQKQQAEGKPVIEDDMPEEELIS